MPLIETSTYVSPPWLRGGHAQTIFPALFRRTHFITRERERIETPDGDFLDIDWHRPNGFEKLAILNHGLEGSTADACVQGMADALSRAGWDILAWNQRGCGGEINRLLRTYHSGSTDDLDTVIGHALRTGRYKRIGLVGFSLGGNVVLKYLGDLGAAIDPRVDRAVAFSVPCDLASSSIELERPANRIYMARFMKRLREKVRAKIKAFPGQLSDAGQDRMWTFREFDGAYTAPLNGFCDAEDYWTRASSKPVLGRITIPTLLVNAQNDPFLAAACHPIEAARENPQFYLERPRHGGHLGFAAFNKRNEYWSEARAVEFLR